MATLPAADLKVIRDIYAKRTVHHGPHRNVNDIACWNWALAGIVDQTTMVRPEGLCDFVSRDTLNAELRRQRCQQLGAFHTDARNADLDPAEIAWFGNAANRQAIDAVKNAWNQSRQDAAAVLVASKAIARLAIEANGLTVSNHATDYKICVYYYNYVTQPNFQHWWIEIEGVWFELFPGLDDIQIGREAQPLGGNKVDFSIYVQDLHQEQVNRIHQSLQGYDGQWWHDHSTKECSACQVQFGFSTRRHHCRGCGQIFCASCTSHTRTLAHIIQRPNSSRQEQGRVRVCDACYANP